MELVTQWFTDYLFFCDLVSTGLAASSASSVFTLLLTSSLYFVRISSELRLLALNTIFLLSTGKKKNIYLE